MGQEIARAPAADVIVIGAGPAGSVAGALLARAGHRVVCLEAGTFPRFQIGESLLPRCCDLLEAAGLLEAVTARGYMQKRGATFIREAERERFSFAEMFPGQAPMTFQVPRDDFDQTLATEARRLGVDVRFNTRVDVARIAEGRAEVDATDVETGVCIRFEGKRVIDCSGYGRVLPRLLELERPSTLSSRLSLFTHVEGDRRPPGAEAGDIWVAIHPRGAWIWVIPFSNGRTSVGVVLPRDLLESFEGSDRDRLMALIAEEPSLRDRLGSAVPVMHTRRLEGWSAAVSALQGPGWVLTGNAAEFLDPVFSSGVTLALESAQLAAQLTARELAGETVDWEAEYAQAVRGAVGVFRTFVEAWYRDELTTVLLRCGKNERIKRAITAVLGGYVRDLQNPFVRDGEGLLRALIKLA